MKRTRIIAPSILAADFTKIGEAINQINEAGGDWIHLDVMDGSFVPEITFGAQLVRQIRPLTSLPLDVHLMIEKPWKHFEKFRQAGADNITIHYENCPDLRNNLMQIQELGCKAGVSIVPSTCPAKIEGILDLADIILVMTVRPGFGGQTLNAECLDKVAELSSIRKQDKRNFMISIDGGVNLDTAEIISDTDTDIFVMGTAFFSAGNKKETVDLFKGL